MTAGASPKSLLLLIDLQVAFCDAVGSMATQGRSIVDVQRAARVCDSLAVRGREAGVQVAWTRMMFRPDYSDGGVLISTLRPNLARVGALRKGSGDEEFSSLVRPRSNDWIIDKARFSAVYGTGLEIMLRAGTYLRVFVAGVTTSMCVESTVRDLSQRDYDVYVVVDACADFESVRHDAALAAMEFGFARMIDSAGAASAMAPRHV
jgi:nicotinamidase-related amidase